MGKEPEGSRYSSHPQAQLGLPSRQGPLSSVLGFSITEFPHGQGPASAKCVPSCENELPRSERRQSGGHEQMAQRPEAECNLWLSVSPSLPCRGARRQRATTNSYNGESGQKGKSCDDMSNSYIMVFQTHTKSQTSGYNAYLVQYPGCLLSSVQQGGFCERVL